MLRPGVSCTSTAVQTLSTAVFKTRVDQLGMPVWGNSAAHGCTPEMLVKNMPSLNPWQKSRTCHSSLTVSTVTCSRAGS